MECVYFRHLASNLDIYMLQQSLSLILSFVLLICPVKLVTACLFLDWNKQIVFASGSVKSLLNIFFVGEHIKVGTGRSGEGAGLLLQ